jgi:hypothetical protein
MLVDKRGVGELCVEALVCCKQSGCVREVLAMHRDGIAANCSTSRGIPLLTPLHHAMQLHLPPPVSPSASLYVSVDAMTERAEPCTRSEP